MRMLRSVLIVRQIPATPFAMLLINRAKKGVSMSSLLPDSNVNYSGNPPYVEEIRQDDGNLKGIFSCSGVMPTFPVPRPDAIT